MDLEVKLTEEKNLKLLENPKVIVGICPSCEKKSIFNYEGIQEGYGHTPSFLLYTCRKCSSTISKEFIKTGK
jgi:DNA-directed RNA polymerase subunit M/transcription elongation factor TFIIS